MLINNNLNLNVNNNNYVDKQVTTTTTATTPSVLLKSNYSTSTALANNTNTTTIGKKTKKTNFFNQTNKITSKSTSSLSSALLHFITSNNSNNINKTTTTTTNMTSNSTNSNGTHPATNSTNVNTQVNSNNNNNNNSNNSNNSNQSNNNVSKINLQQQITNGLFIRKEIQRFESVHPNIYSVYDLIDSIQDFNLQQQIREHIVNIEDSFVNSQEWTLSRSVPDLKLGVLGSTNSGKSSLVHRFLTGTYIQEESPEGGRFKKEVIIDGQSYLLLIRDEGGAPEMQFTHWVDAVIFVFSLENEDSFLTAHQYYLKMQNYRNMSDIPFVLVGTQDYISETNPRIIDDSRARNLALELKKCSYYETCAMYGLHVERVFHDACQKVVSHRANILYSVSNTNSNLSPSTLTVNRPSTPQSQQQQQQANSNSNTNSSSIRLLAGSHLSSANNAQMTSSSSSALSNQNQNHFISSSVISATVGLNGYTNNVNGNSSHSNTTSPQTIISSNNHQTPQGNNQQQQTNSTVPQASNSNLTFFMANPHLINPTLVTTSQPNSHHNQPPHSALSQITPNNNINTNNNIFKEPFSIQQQQQQQHSSGSAGSDSKTKNTNSIFGFNNTNKDAFMHSEVSNNNLNANSNLNSNANLMITPCSTPNQKRKDTNRRRSNLFTPNKKEDKQNKLNDMGVGRSIPIKQGFLYKKTNSTINKDWKKKFVTLNDDGSLRYYPSMNDYMDDVHGKEIDLQKTTIKIPGANKPRIGKSLLHLDTVALNTQKLNQDINSLNLNSNSTSQFDSNSKTQFYDDSTNSFNQQNFNQQQQQLQQQQHHQPVLIQNGLSNINENSTNQHTNNYLARIDINSKKRHRRIKSNHKSDQKEDEQEGFEFIIVSLDNKQWHFEAASNEEREEWVQAVEQQILSSLQLNETNKLKAKHGGFTADNLTILTMKSVPGNMACADCDAPNPVWASLNHGSLICIECSGIHRNLGTHLSRVRSLELDDWSNELIQVMTSIGNKMINSIYEANTKTYGRLKPNSNTPREEKEKWIRAKYENKLFLAPLNHRDVSIGKLLIDAVNRQDIPSVILCLAHSKPDDVNTTLSQIDKRTCLHIAASFSNLVILQLLIWYGADVELTDNQGRNALSYARNSNSNECAQLLIYNGCTETSVTNGNNGTTGSTLTRKSHSSTSTSHILNTNTLTPTYDKLSFNTNVI